MPTIQVSQETADFLKKLLTDMASQSNKGTADPFYLVVCCEKEIAVPEGQTENVRYFDKTTAASCTEEDIRKYCQENDQDFDAYVACNCTKYDVDTVDVYENIFLTRAGYDAHMELNEHNYRHYVSHHPYVLHAFRNPEMAGLIKALKDIGNNFSKS